MSLARFSFAASGPVVLGAFLALGATAPDARAQRPVRQTVAGPAVSREHRVDEESVYRLLRAQLQLLVEVQDSVHARTGQYAASFGAGEGAVTLAPRAGVSVTLEHASRLGWAAVARHAALAGKSCVIWVGMVRPERRPVTQFDQNRGGEAEIVCDLVP